MNSSIDIASALRQLPMETPAHSLWPALQAHMPKPSTRPKWPWALAASALLLALMWQTNPSTPAKSAQQAGHTPTTSALQQSMARSVQLEPYFYAAQDDSISSASVIAANLNLEVQLSAIDAQLQTQPSEPEALALWRERVVLLDEGIALNHANARMHANGHNYDLALASLN